MTFFLPVTCGKNGNDRRQSRQFNSPNCNKELRDSKSGSVIKKKSKTVANQKKMTKNLQNIPIKETIIKVGGYKRRCSDIDRNDNNIEIIFDYDNLMNHEVTCIDDSDDDNDKTSNNNPKNKLQIFESNNGTQDHKKKRKKKTVTSSVISENVKSSMTASPITKKDSEYEERNIIFTEDKKHKKHSNNESCNDTTSIITIKCNIPSNDGNKKEIENKKDLLKPGENFNEYSSKEFNRRRQKTFPTLDDVLSGEGKSTNELPDNKEPRKTKHGNGECNKNIIIKDPKNNSHPELEETMHLECTSDKSTVT
uniref:Origin recognition complex subunit 1 n=1 Tax=Strongyloides venezuelensis TaxID=75913 RepID=A0A0K0F5A9_STRVS